MRKIYVPSWRCESWVQCHANNVGSLMKNSCGGDKDTNDMVGVRACDVAYAVWRAQALHCRRPRRSCVCDMSSTRSEYMQFYTV